MEHTENNAGLGKDHDAAARDHDLAKKQSDKTPAAENLDMEPNSVDKSEINLENEAVHEKAEEYTKKEHEKAENWESTGDDQ